MSNIRPLYSIDTCSLTEVRRVYPKDVFPGVWTLLDHLADLEILIAVEMVSWELEAQDDEVFGWANAHADIFRPLNAAIQNKGREIINLYPTLIDLKKRKTGADPFIIALASIESLAVVTQEKPSGGPNKVKIPDVCRSVGVECIPVLEMLRRAGLRL
jgi:hypothetical protein